MRKRRVAAAVGDDLEKFLDAAFQRLDRGETPVAGGSLITAVLEGPQPGGQSDHQGTRLAPAVMPDRAETLPPPRD